MVTYVFQNDPENVAFQLHSNLSIEDILYSEYLVIADRFSRNRENLDQTLIANSLYNGHFYRGHSYSGHYF